MIIEWNNHTYRVEKSERSIVGYHVWVEIPQADFTGRTRTHWRRLKPGPVYHFVAHHYELEKARRKAEMFESTEVCE